MSTSVLKLGHGRHISRKHFGGEVRIVIAVQVREEPTRLTRHKEIVQILPAHKSAKLGETRAGEKSRNPSVASSRPDSR
jgi:hypothetical protein